MTATEILYLLLVFSLPIVRPFTVDLGRFDVLLTDALFVLVAASLAVAIVRGRRRFVWDWFYLPALLYVAALLLSALASDGSRAGFVKVLGTAYLAALSIVTVNVVHSQAVLRRVLRVWVAATIVTVVVGVLCVALFYAGLRDAATLFGLTHFGSLPAGPYPRGTALFRNMNMLCNYLIPSLLIVLAMRACGWLTGWWPRLLTGGIWVTAVFTASAGLGGMALAGAEWRRLRTPLVFRGRSVRLWYGAAILAALVPLAAAVVLPASATGVRRFLLPGTAVELELAPRLFLWRSAFETFRSNPILGQGPATRVASHEFVTLSGQWQHLTDPHNVALSIAAQGGILAFVAFAAIAIAVARRCRRAWGRDDATGLLQTALGLSLLAAVGYHGLTGSFEDARHLWVIAGLAVAIGRTLDVDGVRPADG